MIWDVLSLLVLVYWALPVALWSLYPVIPGLRASRETYLLIFIVSLMLQFLLKATRRLPVYHSLQLRPAGARDCNLFNRGGSYDGTIGMPSGHVLTTAFVLASLYFTGDVSGLPAAAGILSMCASRYYRRCHTLLQVVAGAVLGGVSAFLLHRALEEPEKQKL
ncbi:hypothetical protein TSOC_013333 [Tetrabaena socialis]|uniref:Phosphatidic acid phosphatase type 2/haloperoxidase domain-containing protein n=1 Tax=Tetrabaena socialis TaxID=47790 RepID=A0A2J7ZKN0_9CHLO|nr:hypothetical protein TSOC_013333 [Tetrabaena socialis]|eukprot:PNH00822.1 hypothetical protein TSOC_013333 [Tetrabaena socialis]